MEKLPKSAARFEEMLSRRDEKLAGLMEAP